jgi:nitroreductase
LGPATLAVAICIPEGSQEFDAGRAGQNIMLAAWSEGLATCPVRIHHADCGREVLNLPAEYRIVMVIALGHPDPNVPMSLGRIRQPLEEYAYEERWPESDKPPS